MSKEDLRRPPCVGCGEIHGSVNVAFNCLEKHLAASRKALDDANAQILAMVEETRGWRAAKAAIQATEWPSERGLDAARRTKRS